MDASFGKRRREFSELERERGFQRKELRNKNKGGRRWQIPDVGSVL
jgi:hypothetical protein